MKYKNTTPPIDLEPKKLKYDNYMNSYLENNYCNFRNNNILSPTPNKNNFFSNQNFIQKDIPSFNNYNNNYNNQDTRNNYNNYHSKYPVELSNRKMTFGENNTNKILNNAYNSNNYNNYLNPRPNNNLFGAPQQDNNKITYKVVKAEDYLKNSSLKNENNFCDLRKTTSDSYIQSSKFDIINFNEINCKNNQQERNNINNNFTNAFNSKIIKPENLLNNNNFNNKKEDINSERVARRLNFDSAFKNTSGKMVKKLFKFLVNESVK